jgi:hypothetical protein
VQLQGWETAGYTPAEGTGQPAPGDSVPSAGRPEGMGTQVGRNKGLVAVLVGGLVLVIVGAMIAFSGNGSGVGTPNPNLQGSSGSGLDQPPQNPPNSLAEEVKLTELSTNPVRSTTPPTVEPTGQIERPPELEIPPAPQPPQDPNDQVAMAQYLNDLQSYQDEIARIQDDYKKQMELYDTQISQGEVTETDTPIPTDLPTQTSLYTEKTVIGRSASGRDLHMTVIGYPGEKALVVVGAIDGSQTDTTSLINDLISRLESDPTQIPPDALLYLIPGINPDGSRLNRNGVDLNRNWDTFDWRSNPPQPGAAGGVPGAGGSRPFSEPETQALRDVILGIKNQGHELVLLVLHSSVRRGDLIYPAFVSAEAHAPSVILAREMGTALNYTFDTSWDDYQTPGEAIDWVAMNGFPAVDIVWQKGETPSMNKLIDALVISLK